MSGFLKKLTLAGVVAVAWWASSAGAEAQDSAVWSDIDCAQSKIVAPSGLKCRSTQEFSAPSPISAATGRSTFRRWVTFGLRDGIKLYYYVAEGVSIGGFIVNDASLENSMKNLSPYARGAANFSVLANMNDGDYVTFTNDTQDSCVGIRKLGPGKRGGYKWIAYASKCVAKGKSIATGEIGQLISEVNFRD